MDDSPSENEIRLQEMAQLDGPEETLSLIIGTDFDARISNIEN